MANFGRQVKFAMPRNGDLVYNTYLNVTVPLSFDVAPDCPFPHWTLLQKSVAYSFGNKLHCRLYRFVQNIKQYQQMEKLRVIARTIGRTQQIKYELFCYSANM
jgi:hypothetical protein